MTERKPVFRDERTAAIENRSYGLAFGIIVGLLLLDVMVRALLYDQAAWDLLAIVVIGSAAATVYQFRQSAFGTGIGARVALIVLVAGLVAIDFVPGLSVALRVTLTVLVVGLVATLAALAKSYGLRYDSDSGMRQSLGMDLAFEGIRNVRRNYGKVKR